MRSRWFCPTRDAGGARADSQAQTRALFAQFSASLHANFGADARAWQLLDDVAHTEARREAMVDALATYHLDRQAWERVLQG